MTLKKSSLAKAKTKSRDKCPLIIFYI